MANKSISQLTAGGAVSGTDLFPDVQTAGVGPVKVTATQLATFFWYQPTLVNPALGAATATSINIGGATLGSNVLAVNGTTLLGGATTVSTGGLTVGVAGTTGGTIALKGSTAGTLTLQVPATVTDYSITLPSAVAAGNGYILTSTTGGVTSWTNPTSLGIDLDVGTTAITNGTTGRVLYDNAGVLGEYTAVPVSFGGTNATSASITAFNNITGYTATGATGTTSTNLVFSTSPSITTPTFVTSATGPLFIGGTGTTSTLTLRSTSGVGATGADIIFQTGNNGATEAMRVLNSGNVGIGISSPASILQVKAALNQNFAISGTVSFANSVVIAGLNDAASANIPVEFRGDGFAWYNAGTHAARISSVGNFLLGGTAARGTTAGSAHLDIFDGTAPVGTLTNGISLYSSSGDFHFMTSAGDAFKVGYRNVPPVGTKTSSYQLATTDVGKYVQVSTGGAITIPDTTFAEGDIVSIFNNTSGNITITCSITTAYIAGTDTDKATMTLATRGVATVLFISSTVCVVSGNVS